MILGQKEEPMDAETFIALGRNRIALRGYTEYDIQTGRALLKITAWTILPNSTLVKANYSRAVVLETGKPWKGDAYDTEITFCLGSRLLPTALQILEDVKQNHPHQGFLVRSQVAYTRFVRQFDNTPEQGARTYYFCDPLFATHLRVMHALCRADKKPVGGGYHTALNVFSHRLGALIHEHDTMISRGALYPMF